MSELTTSLPHLKYGKVYEVYETSFRKIDSEIREHHGRVWSVPESKGLEDLFKCGMPLEGICRTLQRPSAGVLSKLVKAGYLKYDTAKDAYLRLEPPEPCKNSLNPQPPIYQLPDQQLEETNMTAKIIETKVFVNGTDATNMDDMTIYNLMAKTEAEIAKLKSIKAVSRKLTERIEDLEKQVQKLANYVDDRS